LCLTRAGWIREWTTRACPPDRRMPQAWREHTPQPPTSPSLANFSCL
jgi:hypothetical protein